MAAWLCVVVTIACLLRGGVSGSVDLSNWMRDMMPVIGNATLLDLSLPGAHDMLTFDLSTTVSDGAEDIPDWLSDLMHDVGDAFDFGNFIRNQVTCASLPRYARCAPRCVCPVWVCTSHPWHTDLVSRCAKAHVSA
jgi:hypothetical protein